MIPVLPRGVRMKEDRVRGMWVLLAPERTIQLDPIGQAILGEVDGVRSIEQIARSLSEKFGAPFDAVRTDTTEFLSALAERRIVDIT